jgi:ABC-type dipeptide/oligopeptide/nickel transport system permease subunit
MATALEGTAARARSDFWLRFRRTRNAMLGALIVTLVILIALLAPWIAPRDFELVDMLAVWAAPSAEHLLGADGLGRDTLSRIIVGAQISLLVACSVLVVTLAIGITLGMLAAWFGGWAETLIMRTVDIIFAFPELILAILVAAIIGPGTLTVIVALSLVWWPGIARLTRSLVLSLKSELFVDAAIACGSPPRKILVRHLLPNIIAPIIVRLDRCRLHHHGGGDALLSRHRRAGAAADLGRHDPRRPAGAAHRSLSGALRQRRARHHDHRLQPFGRRPARHP